MKTIWARVGGDILLTEDEFDRVKESVESGTDDWKGIIRQAINDGGFEPDGDCYIPVNCFDLAGIKVPKGSLKDYSLDT